MPRLVQVAAGQKDVVLPDLNRYQAGAQVVLTDAQFAQVTSAVTAGVLIDLGATGGGTVTVNGKTGSNITLVPADLGLPKVTPATTAPSTPAVNDIWVDTSGG
jgi:hypothetical protein